LSVEFLSGEWFSELAADLAAGEKGGGALRFGQLVTGVPEGLVSCWTVVLEDQKSPRVEKGSIENAETVLVMSYEAAWQLVSRKRSAAQLLEAGEVKVRGDANRLVAALDDIEALAARTGSLAGRTTLRAACEAPRDAP
jgi:hypothetical protein